MKHGLTLRHGRIELHDGDHAFRLVADSFALQPGQTVALTGASGSGKTLFLELLGLLRSPEGGTEYTCSGENLIDLWKDGPRSAALARRRGGLFGFVPQTGALMPFLTVAENIALTQNVTKRQDASWCTHLMDRLGLTSFASMMPGSLSIGQRQRVSIARALAHRPAFIIADEPTAALDSESADVVLELLLSVAADQNCGVILSSHDLDRLSRHDISRMSLSVRSVDGAIISTLEPAPC